MKSPRGPHPLSYVVAFVLGVLFMAAVLITIYQRQGRFTGRNGFSGTPDAPASLKPNSKRTIPTVEEPFLPSVRPTNSLGPKVSSNEVQISAVLGSKPLSGN